MEGEIHMSHKNVVVMYEMIGRKYRHGSTRIPLGQSTERVQDSGRGAAILSLHDEVVRRYAFQQRRVQRFVRTGDHSKYSGRRHQQRNSSSGLPEQCRASENGAKLLRHRASGYPAAQRHQPRTVAAREDDRPSLMRIRIESATHASTLNRDWTAISQGVGWR